MMSGKLVWSFQRVGGLGIGWCGGGVFMVGGVLAGLQRFYLGIWSVRHLRCCVIDYLQHI